MLKTRRGRRVLGVHAGHQVGGLRCEQITETLGNLNRSLGADGGAPGWRSSRMKEGRNPSPAVSVLRRIYKKAQEAVCGLTAGPRSGCINGRIIE